ncbi:type II toxin-antitoxin system HicA family toxin [Candidatus Woesearchaeota archaeon]|nr:type II toxin-antitoxin system HicA family toxin [Candidatus Woesearchaeota archaeon]
MKLPLVSGNAVIKLLQREGFAVVRQRGSHVSLHKKINEKTMLVVVPLKDEIKKGTLLSIIRQAGMTREEFINKIK